MDSASATTNEAAFVLMSTEVELYVQALRPFAIEEIGSGPWSAQHEKLEKLNMQAVLSASRNETEYVKEALITFEKMPVLVHELINIELWRDKVLPQLVKIGFKPKNSFVVYMILYHEAVLVNLLETILFHSEVCQALGETVYDLVDYCYRQMTDQIRVHAARVDEPKIKEIKSAEEADAEPMEELLEQSNKIQFDILMKMFSIVRYIVDNVANLDLGVVNSLLNKHDFILLLVQAMEQAVWSRKDRDGKFFKYVDNKWKLVPAAERFQLTKVEGQVWICLYELLLNPNCVSKYDYTDFKKNQILKLRSHLNEVLIDQIPNLAALQRFLEQLAVAEPPPYKSSLIIEPVLIIYESALSKYKGKWRDLARQQAEQQLSPSEAEIAERARRWTETYSSEALEGLIDEPARCAECGEPAPKRCSRCQSEWYCRRECQVKNWPKHKKACDLILEATKKAAAAAATAKK